MTLYGHIVDSMTRLLKIGSLSVSVTLLASCAATIPQPQPYPKNYQTKIRAHMDMSLYDGSTARYRFPKTPELTSSIGGKQYSVPFSVNAKNRYGGFVGFRPYRAFFLNGEVQRANESPLDIINLR